MNILIISSDNPYSPFGGLGYQVIETILNLDKIANKYKIRNISILCPKKDKKNYNINEKITNINLKLIEYEYDPIHLHLGDQSVTNFNESIKLLRCYQHIYKDPPNIIHSFDWDSVNISRFLVKEYKCKWVMHFCLSHIEEYYDIDSFLKNVNFKLNIQKNDCNHKYVENIETLSIMESDKTIVVSENYRHIFSSRVKNNFRNKIITIPNGINSIEFKRENINVPDDFKLEGHNKIKILFMGRFTMSKNLLSIIFSNIPDNIDIILAGKNMGTSNLGIISEVGLNENELKNKNIYIVEALKNPERLWYMKEASAIIMPSIHEPFGLVALEALMIKTPLLCSIQGGLSDFLDNDNCINCGISPDTISFAINKFITMNDNDKLNMIENGYKKALTYKWCDVSKKIADIYADLLS